MGNVYRNRTTPQRRLIKVLGGSVNVDLAVNPFAATLVHHIVIRASTMFP